MEQFGVGYITHARRLWLYLLCGLVFVFLLAPILIIIPISFSGANRLTFPPPSWSLKWFASYFSSPEWLSATWISVEAAVLTTILSTLLGVPAAYGLFRMTGRRFKPAAYMLILLPAIMPTIILAIGLFIMFAQVGLNNTLTGLVLSHSALALPFVVILVSAGFKTYDFTQEMAAQSLGASPLKAFVTVTLPQIRLSILSGALMAFLTSFDEVVISNFISSGTRATLTKKMFSTLRNEINPTLSAVATLLIGVTVVAMLLAALQSRVARPR
jgi:putative spermidine/putrescine transport system permease protein